MCVSIIIWAAFRNMQWTSTLRAYKKVGQWIIHIYGLWINLHKTFHIGLAEDSFFQIENEDSDE